LKNRLKIFSTSKSAFIQAKNKKNTAVQYNDVEYENGLYPGLGEFNNTNKSVKVTNNTMLGWERTTDHEFQIASYSDMNNRGVSTVIDPSLKNQTDLDSQYTSFQDQRVSAGLAAVMKDIMFEQHNRLQQGDMDYHIEHYMVPVVQQVWTNFDKLQRREIENEQMMTETFKDHNGRTAKISLEAVLNKNWETESDRKSVAEFMNVVTRMANKSQKNRIIETLQSAKTHKDFMSIIKRHTNHQVGKLGRDWQETSDWKESKSITNFANKRANRTGDQMRKILEGEMFKSKSKERFAQAIAKPYTKMAYGQSNETQQHLEYNTNDRLIGKMGSKFNRDLTLDDNQHSVLNDI
jgi:hypothetical protein